MKPFKIKSKKQDNGLWGMPMNIVYLNRSAFMDDDDEVKFSGILIALSEDNPNARISIECILNTGIFKAKIEYGIFELQDKNHYIDIKHFELIDNMLFFIKDDEERKMCNRIKKIRKIKNEMLPTLANNS